MKMVRKRPNLDCESKMPVRSSERNKAENQRDAESASMSEKDNSDFSSKGAKVWSRELRNRFVIANKKRSLRFTDNVAPSRHMRSCRMAITNRQHYTLSQSDDDDDHVFPARTSRRLQHPKRRHSSPEPQDEAISEIHTPAAKRNRSNPIVNGHTSKSPPDEEETPEDGIRRSTRQRKLKYENYSDSWIVGAQTLRGYPQNYVDLRDVYNTPYRSQQSKKLKHEPMDEEEEEEEDMKAGDDTEDGDTEDHDNIATQDVTVEKRRSERRSAVDKERAEQQEGEAGEAENAPKNGPFEDMYSRVKRERSRRSIYDAALLNRRRERERKCIQTQGNSSESESSSEDEPPRRSCRTKMERVVKRKYHLRETKPTVKRFQIVEDTRKKSSRTLRAVLCGSMRRHRRRSSSSSSSSDERFDRKPKSTKTRSRLPHLLAGAEANTRSGKPEAGGRLADVDPVSLDTSIRFCDVGGLEEHVRCLQEMVVFPMLYSEIFRKYHVKPPKGVLFHGPPGTGKTLIARALANECSQGDRKVTFFMRKGADCLSKWVGESERQLRLLFEQANQARPSIIFFDELDGLAPVRSAKQDQIHASIVSTLLALMDGLDDRGDVVVIGATNRVDAIDPALRRPGRFDRELLFPLPANQERQEILKIHVSKWEQPPNSQLLSRLAERAAGYCGSDLRALCSEAVIQALRRRYPQIYKSSRKLLLNPDCVKVERCDFDMAQLTIVPASHRAAPGFGRKLPNYLEPLLGESVTELTSHVRQVFPSGFVKACKSTRMVKWPRLLVVGQPKASSLLAATLLHRLEQCPVYTLDLATIHSESARSPEEATVQVLNEVRCNVPAVLYVPGLGELWRTVGPAVRAIFTSLLSQLDPTLPVLLLATTSSVDYLPHQLRQMFSEFRHEVYRIRPPTSQQKEEFFRPLLLTRPLFRPPRERKKEPLEELPEAPPTPPPVLNEQQMQKLYTQEEHKLRELRIFLRQICDKLARNKAFFMFSKPVDIEEVPDYLNIINEPMDLETMMTKIDLHKYTCAQDFLNDVELICANALEYNPDRDPADKLIRHRACYLRDTAYALIKAEMDSDFEETCREIRKSRRERGATTDKFAPDFVQTAAMLQQKKLLKQTNDTNAQSSSVSKTSVSEPVASGSGVKRRLTRSSLVQERRRKKRLWSRGVLSKARRVGAHSVNQSTSADIKNKSLVKKEDEVVAASSVDDTATSEQDMHATSTPIKRHSQSQVDIEDDMLVNGVDGLSSEDEVEVRLGGDELTDELPITSDGSQATESSELSKGSGRQVVLNKCALARLLTEAVRVTGPVSSLDVLVDLYASLRSIISRYRRLWIRTKLPQELDAELKRFEAEVKDEEGRLDQDETLNTSREDASVF